MSNAWYRVGHTTRDDVKTGCTVIVFDELKPVEIDVRGGAPGTRGATTLDPGNIGMLDAIVLSGGSAMGLGVATGVERYLVEQGRGVPTFAMPVPLTASAIIYDLAVGAPVPPTDEDGYQAVISATDGPGESGNIGAGVGATVGKLGGKSHRGGLGVGQVDLSGSMVTAIVVVNAVGSIVDPKTGQVLSGDPDEDPLEAAIGDPATWGEAENTTIGCVLFDQPVSRRVLTRAAISAHAGLAHTVVPSHTPGDGDTFFAAASGIAEVDQAELFRLTVAAQLAVERAILNVGRL